MAYKYDIVGSYYDKCAKGNKYREEEVIKIPGVKFNSLKDVDRFTASTTKSDFENMIKDNYTYKNHFSIRVTNSEGRSFYRSIIFDNKELVDLITSIKKKTIKSPNGPRTVDYIMGNNKLFLDLWDKVDKLVKIKNSDAVTNAVDDNYAFIIRRYIESDANEMSEDYTMIREWFREYNVFRKYFISKVNPFISNMNVRNNNYKTPMKVNNSNVVYRSHNNDNKDYDYDKEEFFDEKEIEMMSDGDENVPFHFTGRKI